MFKFMAKSWIYVKNWQDTYYWNNNFVNLTENSSHLTNDKLGTLGISISLIIGPGEKYTHPLHDTKTTLVFSPLDREASYLLFQVGVLSTRKR